MPEPSKLPASKASSEYRHTWVCCAVSTLVLPPSAEILMLANYSARISTERKTIFGLEKHAAIANTRRWSTSSAKTAWSSRIRRLKVIRLYVGLIGLHDIRDWKENKWGMRLDKRSRCVTLPDFARDSSLYELIKIEFPPPKQNICTYNNNPPAAKEHWLKRVNSVHILIWASTKTTALSIGNTGNFDPWCSTGCKFRADARYRPYNTR
jgi:hypothetical protein